MLEKQQCRPPERIAALLLEINRHSVPRSRPRRARRRSEPADHAVDAEFRGHHGLAGFEPKRRRQLLAVVRDEFDASVVLTTPRSPDAVVSSFAGIGARICDRPAA